MEIIQRIGANTKKIELIQRKIVILRIENSTGTKTDKEVWLQKGLADRVTKQKMHGWIGS